MLAPLFLYYSGSTGLKVTKNINFFMKTQFGPKNNVIIVRISYSRAEILTIIMLLFGPNGVFIHSF